jgi:hypothetical protein
MQITLQIPDTLPETIVRQRIRQFERRLEKEAQTIPKAARQLSKWAQVARAAHEESPLQGLSEYVLACSEEIRHNFAFHHDAEER